MCSSGGSATGDTSPALSAELEAPAVVVAAAEHRIDLRRFSPIESLDYEAIENDYFKQDRRIHGGGRVQYVLLKWALCFLVGGLAGGVGFFNNLAVENLAGVKFVVTSNMMLAHKYATAFGVFAVSNLVLTVFATVITAYVAPAGAGSGIPEVKAYLNGVDVPGIFSVRTIVVKVRGSSGLSMTLYFPITYESLMFRLCVK